MKVINQAKAANRREERMAGKREGRGLVAGCPCAIRAVPARPLLWGCHSWEPLGFCTMPLPLLFVTGSSHRSPRVGSRCLVWGLRLSQRGTGALVWVWRASVHPDCPLAGDKVCQSSWGDTGAPCGVPQGKAHPTSPSQSQGSWGALGQPQPWASGGTSLGTQTGWGWARVWVRSRGWGPARAGRCRAGAAQGRPCGRPSPEAAPPGQSQPSTGPLHPLTGPLLGRRLRLGDSQAGLEPTRHAPKGESDAPRALTAFASCMTDLGRVPANSWNLPGKTCLGRPNSRDVILGPLCRRGEERAHCRQELASGPQGTVGPASCRLQVIQGPRAR